MGSSSSQAPAELSEDDIEFISSKAKIDHESVKVWYEKLKVCFSSRCLPFDIFSLNFLGSLSKWKNFQGRYCKFLTEY
jgi:hypothetical protein